MTALAYTPVWGGWLAITLTVVVAPPVARHLERFIDRLDNTQPSPRGNGGRAKTSRGVTSSAAPRN